MIQPDNHAIGNIATTLVDAAAAEATSTIPAIGTIIATNRMTTPTLTTIVLVSINNHGLLTIPMLGVHIVVVKVILTTTASVKLETAISLAQIQHQITVRHLQIIHILLVRT
jgi:hypothetical protein